MARCFSRLLLALAKSFWIISNNSHICNSFLLLLFLNSKDPASNDLSFKDPTLLELFTNIYDAEFFETHHATYIYE